MGYFGKKKSFEEKEAAREIKKQNKLKKKGIEVNERDGSAADERNMLKQNRKEKIGNFFNTVSNARERSFANKMNRKLIKADTRNTVAQIEGHESVADKNTSRAMDIQIMRDKPKMAINISTDNSVHQVDNSSTTSNTTTTTSKPSKPKTRKQTEGANSEPSRRKQGDLTNDMPNEPFGIGEGVVSASGKKTSRKIPGGDKIEKPVL